MTWGCRSGKYCEGNKQEAKKEAVGWRDPKEGLSGEVTFN